jgi:hypothetical protein
MSDDPMPGWAQTLQSALAEAISDFRREANERFDAIDRTLTARFEGETVTTNMADIAERHAKAALDTSASNASAILSQQRLIQRLEARVAALEGKP